MKRIITIGCAALAFASVAPPLFAKDHNKGPAPASSIAVQSHNAARNAQIQQSRAAQVQRSRIATQRAVANRDFMNSRRPTVAFGGSDRRDDRRGFETREFRRDFRFRTPPVEVLSGWDRDRVYAWDNHRWHWRNDAWVVFDDTPAVVGEYTAPAYSESSGSVAAEVQSSLATQGYNPGPIDGVIGAQTRAAISDFQADHALPVTGQIDTPLLRTLGL
jgi:hypothetical protein